MTDQYSILDEMENEQLSAAAISVSGATGSPDKAARALELERVTGRPALTIMPDLELVDTQARGAMASEIIQNNPSLQRYVNNNPVAGVISNDDWAELDALTQSVEKSGSERPWAVTRGFVTGLLKQNPELYGEAAEAVGHLVPEAAGDPLKSVPGLLKSIEPQLVDYTLTAKKLRDVSDTSEAFETLGEMFGSGLSSIVPVIAGATIGGVAAGPKGAAVGALAAGSPLSLGEVYKALKDAGVDNETAAGYAVLVLPIMAGLDFAGLAAGPLGQFLGVGIAREATLQAVKQSLVMQVAKGIVTGAAAEGLTEGAQEFVKQATVSYVADKPLFSIDNAFDVLESVVGGALVGGALGGPGAVGVRGQQQNQFDEQRNEVKQLAQQMAPYIAAGVDPPMGLHKELDRIKIEQGKEAVEELAEETKIAVKSLTRERSPEYFQKLMEDNVNSKLYIPAEKVIQLYGDNMPAPEDGILGWVPNLMEQLRTTVLTNGNVVIPKSLWLTNTTPELMTELKDFIRVRENGVSIQEGKDYKEQQKALDTLASFEGPPGTPTLGAQAGAPVNENLPLKERLPPPKSFLDRIWDNYAKRMTPDEFLTSEPLWSGADRLAEENGITHAEAFSQIANIMFGRMGANRYLSVDMAKALLRRAQRAALGIEAVPDRQDEAVQAVRKQGSLDTLEPLLDVAGEKKLYLTRTPSATAFPSGVKGHDFTLVDFRGKEVGHLLLSEQDGGKTIYIEDIGVKSGPQSFGLASIRDILSQLRKEFPNAEKVTGFRVSGAREKADKVVQKGKAELDLRTFTDQELQEFMEGWDKVEPGPEQDPFDMLEGGEVISITDRAKAYVKPKALWTIKEFLINQEIQKILDRVAPNSVRMQAQKLSLGGREVRGFYQPYTDRIPLIAWALHDDPQGTARHEAVHYLRRGGFFTNNEWSILEATAAKDGWFDKYQIDARYPNADTQLKLEEAIAEAYRDWASDPNNVDKAVHTTFEKISKLLAELVEAIERVLGAKPKFDDLFTKVESGEIGSRTGAKPLHQKQFDPEALAQEKQGELDVTRQEDKPIFKTGPAMGVDQRTMDRLLKLIAKRNEEDIEAQLKRATAFQKRIQTEAWKEESEAMEDEVRADLNNRLDISAANFFRYGEYAGQKLEGPKPKLNKAFLTEAQIAQLPPHWVGETGIHPDDAAQFIGYQTGAQLVEGLAQVEQIRGNVRPGEFFHRLVKAETQRRMVAKHGQLEENILAEAEEHALGITQMDLLHEQTIAAGMLAGHEITLSKEDIKEQAELRFNQFQADDVTVQSFLNDSGKAGRRVVEAASKQDFATVFKEQQAQYANGLMGREAVKFAKEMTRLENLIGRLNQRVNLSIDTDFINAAQWLMAAAGIPTKRSVDEITAAMDKNGYKSFPEFAAAQIADGYELVIPDGIALNGVKDFENMTVLERREFHAALQSLSHIGRSIQRVEIEGIEQDRDVLIDQMVANIKTMPRRDPNKPYNPFYRMDASLVRMEEIIKDLDLRQDAGPLWNAVYRPLMEAKHKEYTYEEALTKKLNSIKGDFGKEWRDSLDDVIPNDWFIDPKSGGLPFNMTRGNMINIMLNWGNRSNIDKFTTGWFGKDKAQNAEAQIFAWFETHASKKDWEFAQHVWDIFDEWKKPATELYTKLSGIGPKMIQAEPIVTKHGTFNGGYFPIIKDRVRDDTVGDADPAGFFGPQYQRSTPANNYTLTRTGKLVKVSFQYPPEEMAARMRQEVHDLSYREPVIEAWKILRSKKLRSAIKEHYGVEYDDQIEPWLHRVANQSNLDEKANKWWTDWMRRIRLNVIGHSLPLNLKVLGSPDVGLFDPRDVGRVLGNMTHYTELAHAKSKEIPHTFRNMDRDFREQLERTIVSKGWDRVSADAVRLGFFPIVKFSQGFRIITFVTEYEKALVEGKDEGTAIALADSLVRQRHGSGATVDLPAIMTGSEGMKMITMFYGYFNTMYNWQRQLPGNFRDRDFGKLMENFYGSVLIGAMFGAALFNKWDKDDNWFKFIAKALTLQGLGTLPMAREAGGYMIEGFTPSTPWGSVIKAVGSTAADVRNWYKDKPVKKPIAHAANVIGLGLRLPMAQIGRTSQFAHDVYTDKQRPENIWQWASGIIHGEAVRK